MCTRIQQKLAQHCKSIIFNKKTNNEKTNFIPKRQKSQKYSLESYYNPLNRNKMGLMKGQKNITVIKGKGETTENVVKKKDK